MPARALLPVCLAVLPLLAGCAMRSHGPANVVREIERGDKARRHHHLPSALSHYERAERDAAVLGAGPLEAEAALKRVRVIEMLSSKSRLEKGVHPGLETPERRRATIERAYARVIAVGSDRQQALARNNLAVMLLRAGRDDEARAALYDIPGVGRPTDPALPEAQLAVYLFNYARVLERRGDYAGAYAECARLLRMRPRFRHGVRKTFRLLQVLRPPRITEAVALLEVVLARGRPRQGGRLALELLDSWSDEPGSRALLPIVARAWLAVGEDCGGFDDATSRELLDRAASSPHLGPDVAELRLACTGDLTPALSAVPVTWLFPRWMRSGWGPPLARLLTAAADQAVHEDGGIRQALARYACASRIAPQDTTARLYAVAVLQSRPDLDPSGGLVRTLLPPIVPARDGDELQDDIRTRILLGRIFEREGRLGPRQHADTAIFQWQWILDHEPRVPGRPTSSETYVRLGGAYEGIGDLDRARIAYRAGLEAFRLSGDEAGAARAEDRLRSLGIRPGGAP